MQVEEPVDGEEVLSERESLSEVDDVVGLFCDQFVETSSKNDDYFTTIGVKNRWGIFSDLLVASKRVAEPPALPIWDCKISEMASRGILESVARRTKRFLVHINTPRAPSSPPSCAISQMTIICCVRSACDWIGSVIMLEAMDISLDPQLGA